MKPRSITSSASHLASICLFIMMMLHYSCSQVKTSGTEEITIQLAINSFEKSIELEPSNESSYLELAKAYMLSGNEEHAIETYQLATKRNPEKLWPLLRLANLYTDLEEYQNALKQFQKALELAPGNEKIQMSISKIHESIGDKSKSNGHLKLSEK